VVPPSERDAHAPTRRCALSRRTAPKERLFRLHLGPDGRPFVDILGKAPGRGVYVAPEALAEALSPKGLGRVFRGQSSALAAGEVASMLGDTATRVEARLAELLGLARRAGALSLGMDASCARIEGDPRGTIVVVAKDAAERSWERVRAASEAGGVPLVRALTRARMGRGLGREALSVVAVWHPVIGRRIADEAIRLEGLVGRDPPPERETRESD